MRTLDQTLVVFRKELIDALRDYKSLGSAFLMPLLFALMMSGSLFFIATIQHQSSTFELHVKGKENAQPLIQWLQEQQIEIYTYNEDPEKDLTAENQYIVLEIPDAFPKEFREMKTAKLNLYSDHSNTQTQVKSRRVLGLIQQWSATTATLRIITRNVAPSVITPVAVNDINIATPQRLAAKILGGLPLILMLIAFVAGIGMTADMAAGEKERKTLEPLLINPIDYNNLVYGKWLSTTLFTFIVCAVGVALQFIALYLSPLSELNVRIELGISDYFLILAIITPVMFLATALQLFVSFMSRSFKDAQTYNSLVMLAPMLPGLYLIFNSGVTQLWQMFIPVLGSQLLLIDIISGEDVPIHLPLVSGTIAILASFVFTFLAMHQLKRESILS